MLMLKSCATTLSLDKQEALLRIRRFSESFVSSWVPRKKSPLPRRLIELQRATLPPPLSGGFRTGAQHAFPRAQPYNLSGSRTNGIVCFACDRPGHIARNCRVKKGVWCLVFIFVFLLVLENKPINSCFPSQTFLFVYFILCFPLHLVHSFFSLRLSRSQAGSLIIIRFLVSWPDSWLGSAVGPPSFAFPPHPALRLLFTFRFPNPRFFPPGSRRLVVILPQSFGVVRTERITAGPGLSLLSYLWRRASIMPMVARSRSGTQTISSQQTFRITFQPGNLFWRGTPRLRNCSVIYPLG